MSDFAPPKFLPRPHHLFPDRQSDPEGPFELPPMMVPPEFVEVGDGHGTSETKTEGWATCEIELFDDEVSRPFNSFFFRQLSQEG